MLSDQENFSVIKSLGFKLNLTEEEARDFIQKNFPGLELTQLVVETDQLLKPMSKHEIGKTLSFFSDPVPQIHFYMGNEKSAEAECLSISRNFLLEETGIIVEHNHLQLPEPFRGKGHAKRLYRIWLNQYELMGVKKIKIEANLILGAFKWAKSFFTADNRSDVDRLLNRAHSIIKDPYEIQVLQRFYDQYYLQDPDGDAFPIGEWAVEGKMEEVFRNQKWAGTIDFNNRAQIRNFRIYLRS